MSCILQKTGKRRGECSEHKTVAYNSKYDAYFCPVSFTWLEPECTCTQEDFDTEECHVPKPRPETALGLTNDL